MTTPPPACTQCGTWVCNTCWEFHRWGADRTTRQICPRCGGAGGFFRPIRHRKEVH